MHFAFWFLIIYKLVVWAPPDDPFELKPTDWFYSQRAYPYEEIPQSFYRSVLKEIKTQNVIKRRRPIQSWKFAGPTNIGGRITDVEADALNPNTIYIGAASGGVFKTTDRGIHWIPIFDENPILSIGDMALDPTDSNILYVGTGEANGGGGSVAYEGNGIFKTPDGGNTWQYLGLENAGSIPKIIIHPSDKNNLYVAAMGKLYGKNNMRGVYNSTDGGLNWSRIFYHSDSVGVIDLAIDPIHPDTLFLSTWERSRKPSGIDYGGPSSGIYRSYDGGKNWALLQQGLPSGNDKGRIGIAIAPSNPSTVYAYYVDESGDFLGVYKSINHGDRWALLNGRVNASGFGWWFGKIYVDPKRENTVYALGLTAVKSIDGGNQFLPITEKFNEDIHVDQHALWINPLNTNQLLLGNDGGLYSSMNGGDNFSKINTLPITQFYTCHVDYQNADWIYGGTQDNSSMRTQTNETDKWKIIWAGDGFACLVDPNDNQYVYTESQYGAFVKSTDGGKTFFNSVSGIDGDDRKNWKTPVEFDPRDPAILYLGTNRLYKSINRGSNWQAISYSLTDDKGWRNFSTITCISVSPIDSKIIYVGTDIGRVWMTVDGGLNWKPIQEGLPERWVTSILADPFSKSKVYLTLSGYKFNENLSHVFVSENYGTRWQDISKGIPPLPCNKIIVDPIKQGHLILATDGGVYRSWTDGHQWEVLGADLPAIVISDLHFHVPSRKLVAASYGRGIYTYSLELGVNAKSSEEPHFSLSIFPNPSSFKVNLIATANKSETVEINLISIKGQLMQSSTVQAKPPSININLDVNNYPIGIYFIYIKYSSGQLYSKKIIIN